MKQISTITVTNAKNAWDTLASALSQVAGELGWKLSETITTSNGFGWILSPAVPGLGFIFTCVSSTGVISYSTGYVSSLTEIPGRVTAGNSIAYPNTIDPMHIDFISSGNETAICVRWGTNALHLDTLITETEAEKVGITISGADISMVKPSSSLITSFSIPAMTTAPNVFTSLLRLPDIYGGAFFRNVYLIYSSPSSATDRTFSVDGQFFRYFGSDGAHGLAFRI